MINQITNNNSNLNSNYKAPQSSVNFSNANSFGAKVKKTVVETPEEKKLKSLGLKIALGALAVGFGVLGISKGLPIISKGKINDFILDLENKSRNLKTKKNKTAKENFLSKVVDKTKAATNFYKSMLNATSIKDAGFKKITDKIPLIGPACVKITDGFKKLSKLTVEKTYAKTNKKFNKLYVAFYNANLKLPKRQAAGLDSQIENLRKNVISNFGKDEISHRLNTSYKPLEGLDEKIWDATYKNPKKFFSDRGAYSNCLAEQISVAERNEIGMKVNKMRAKISHNHNNEINSIKVLLTNINTVLDPLSERTISAMKSIDKAMKDFAKNNTIESRKALLEEIKKLNAMVPDNMIQKKFSESINSFNNSKDGQIQKILNKYKEILPKAEYARLEKEAQKALNHLDKSVDIETNKLFEKMRDLEIGSAPTDVVSILGALGAVGYGVGKADTKDEKISASLKYGIPAIGAVTVSIICATSLVAAGPSLAIGMISGLAINKVGEFADKIRKSLNNNQANNQINKQVGVQQEKI